MISRVFSKLVIITEQLHDEEVKGHVQATDELEDGQSSRRTLPPAAVSALHCQCQCSGSAAAAIAVDGGADALCAKSDKNVRKIYRYSWERVKYVINRNYVITRSGTGWFFLVGYIP